MNGKNLGSAADGIVNGSYSPMPTLGEDRCQTAAIAEQSTSSSCALELLPQKVSGATSTKTAEIDLDDKERDKFSPVSSIGPVAATLATGAEGVNSVNVCRSNASSATLAGNKTPATQFKTKYNTSNNSGSVGTLCHSTSKEEKQRQNEELAILDTSGNIPFELEGPWTAPTFSHETRTFGQAANAQVDDDLFRGLAYNAEDTIGTTRSSQDREIGCFAGSTTSACFIDASSLRDEDEEVLLFPSLDGQHVIEKNKNEQTLLGKCQDSDSFADEDDSPTKNLEKFHNSFAKCKVKSKEIATETVSNSSSNSGNDSPEKEVSLASPASANNLSDEEKLWKRELNSRTKAVPSSKSVNDSSPVLSFNANSSELNDFAAFKRDREQMRVSNSSPSSYVFHHQNKKQFTVHPLNESPKFPVTARNNDHSSTADYSSSSPGSSLIWSSAYDNQNTDFESQHHHKAGLLPFTPHNSIVHIDAGSGSRSCTPRDSTFSSSSFSHQRDSGAYCSDTATDSPTPMPRTPKRSKFDEANPIVSGGASIKDFNTVKAGESAATFKRRTDTCPIVSGGFVSLDFEHSQPSKDTAEDENDVELRVKPRARNLASWIVDMSDCRSSERRKSTSSTSSLENSGIAPRARERSDSTSSHTSGCGFYVSLNGIENKYEDLSASQSSNQDRSFMSKSYTTPKSKNELITTATAARPAEVTVPKQTTSQDSTDQEAPRKPIFSMFIEIGEEKKCASNAFGTRLASSRTPNVQQTKSEEAIKSNASSTETLMSRSANLKSVASHEPNPRDQANDLKFSELNLNNNIDNLAEGQPMTVAALRRLTQKQGEQVSKRHSWGQSRNIDDALIDCKRSISLTVNGADAKAGCGASGDSGLMSIIDKIPLIAKTSSLSVDSYDETHTWSNHSARSSTSASDREQDAASTKLHAMRNKKRRCDVQINETFDKSSLASITDGVLSNDLSPASTTDTDDLTFQQDEELAIREALQQHELTVAMPQQLQQQLPMTTTTTTSQLLAATSNRSSAIMETIIEAKETFSPKKTASGHTLESLHATIEKQKMLLETFNESNAEMPNGEKSNFVKLSDMDKPIGIMELHSPESMMSKSVGGGGMQRQTNNKYSRDEPTSTASSFKGGRPHSWTMTRSHGNSFLNITNSIENLRSLSRLFPHFSKEFSNSLPNELVLDHQMDYIQTDISTDSSLTSSFSRSGLDESSISCRQPRRLGEDLLKMFLQEIATDMVVEVHGRRIKAHKCILRSRCQYFAAMLAGGSGAQSVVSLQGYSYSAVHFALCHIYSGASHPPDGISLMELAALADLLGLEGLKEVTAHALKTNYCHNFHKPCSGCIDGIMQVLPVVLNHALDDLYRKCLRWTCRHYLKVWPTRQFAQLPPDILSRCRQQIVAHLTPESVLDTVLDCENLLRQLATQRWGGICENLVRDILDAAHFYIGDHFASLIASDAFLSLGHNRSCHIPALENVFLQAASTLTPDQACRSYQRITRLNTVLQAKVMHIPTNMGELAKELQGLGEENLDWDADYVRLVGTILSAVEQCLVGQCVRAMRVTAWQRMDLDLRKKIQTLARLTDPADQKRSKPVSKAFSFGGSTRNQDLYQVKLAIQAHSKRALVHQEMPTFKTTQAHNAPIAVAMESGGGIQANHDSREVSGKVFKSASGTQVHKAAYKAGAAQSDRRSLNTQKCASAIAVVSSNKPKANCESKIESKIESAATKVKLNAPKITGPRLVDIRPRYLEPRKSRISANASGPVRSTTSSSIPAAGLYSKAKIRQISSSDSSRNSSPAPVGMTNNLAAKTTKISSKSTDINLDSLGSSPSLRRGRSAVAKVDQRKNWEKTNDAAAERHLDAGIHHSLVESMKSSNKTISQESLSSPPTLSWSNPHLFTHRSVNCAVTNKEHKMKPNTKPKNLAHSATHNIGSPGSSPSSRTTTKSVASRISSVSSTQSTRDAYKRRSISLTAGQQHGGAINNANTNATVTADGQKNQRHSFLSAKSREILAKRAEKNKQLQQELQNHQQQTSSSGDERQRSSNAGLLRAVSYSAVPCAINTQQLAPHNFHSSSIPTRRLNAIQYKKTNIASIKKSPTVTSAHNHYNANSQSKTASNAVIKDDQKDSRNINLKSPNQTNQGTQQSPSLSFTSKLERSSTFCKENSDLNLSELQLIE